MTEDGVQIVGVGQVRIPAADLDRAVAFYRDTLELPLLFAVPEQGLAFFQAGEVRLYIGAETPGEAEGAAIVYYRVRALDAAYEQLRAKGIAFEEVPHTVYTREDVEGRMAFLRDSEGNLLGLMEERTIPAA